MYLTNAADKIVGYGEEGGKLLLDQDSYNQDNFPHRKWYKRTFTDHVPTTLVNILFLVLHARHAGSIEHAQCSHM